MLRNCRGGMPTPVGSGLSSEGAGLADNRLPGIPGIGLNA